MKLQDVPKRRMLPIFDRYEPLVQDHSSIKLYKQCPRKYFWRIVLGFSAKKTGLDAVFSWGTAYHKYREVLELEYQTLISEGVPTIKAQEDAHTKAATEAIKIFKPHPAGVPGKWAHYTLINFLKLLAVAKTWWQQEKKNGQIQVLAIEQPFNLLFPNADFYYGGRFDQVIRWSGRLWVRDFKTTSKKKEYFTKGLNPNDQAIRYIHALSKLHGQRVDGIYYEIIWTSNEGKKENKIVTTSMYTHSVGKTPSQLEVWEEEQISWNEKLVRSRENDMWEMNEEACNFCDYREVCVKPNEASMGAFLKSNFNLKPWDHETVDQKAIDPEDN